MKTDLFFHGYCEVSVDNQYVVYVAGMAAMLTIIVTAVGGNAPPRLMRRSAND